MNTDEIINFQLNLAKRIIHKTGDGEFPLQFQISIYEQCNHDLRMNGKHNNGYNGNNRPATAKQKHLLDDLKITYDENIDIKTACRLIGDALKS